MTGRTEQQAQQRDLETASLRGPTIRAVDRAIWERILTVPFAVEVPHEEDDRDLETIRRVAERYQEPADGRNQSRQTAVDEARRRMEAKQ